MGDNLDVCPEGCSHSNSKSTEVKSSTSPLPDVQQFDSSVAVVDDVIKALKITGGVILRNFLGTEEIDQILSDVNPHLDADQPWGDGKRSFCDLQTIFMLTPIERRFLPS